LRRSVVIFVGGSVLSFVSLLLAGGDIAMPCRLHTRLRHAFLVHFLFLLRLRVLLLLLLLLLEITPLFKFNSRTVLRKPKVTIEH